MGLSQAWPGFNSWLENGDPASCVAWPKNKQKLLDLFSLIMLPGAVRRRGRIRVQVTERGQAEREAAREERGLWAKGEQGRQGPGPEGWGPGPGVYHRRVKLPCGV